MTKISVNKKGKVKRKVIYVKSAKSVENLLNDKKRFKRK